MERIIARRTNQPDEGRVIRSVLRDRYTIEECSFNIQSRLRHGAVLFSELLSGQATRDEIVTYFMAMLELIRMGKLRVQQEDVFGDILMLPSKEVKNA